MLDISSGPRLETVLQRGECREGTVEDCTSVESSADVLALMPDQYRWLVCRPQIRANSVKCRPIVRFAGKNMATTEIRIRKVNQRVSKTVHLDCREITLILGEDLIGKTNRQGFGL